MSWKIVSRVNVCGGLTPTERRLIAIRTGNSAWFYPSQLGEWKIALALKARGKVRSGAETKL